MRSQLRGFTFGSLKFCSNHPLLAVGYTLVLGLGLLAPYDLFWPFELSAVNVHWMSEGNGVEITSIGAMRVPGNTERLFSALTSGSGLTIEVWASTGDTNQARVGGPARIVSFSKDKYTRNFTFEQVREELVLRLRTPKTNLSGANPELRVPRVFSSQKIQHIVTTYDFVEQTVFIDGKLRLRAGIPGGKFDNWDSSHSFLLGNEATGNRPWIGRLFLAAIYDRPLSEREVRVNFLAGKDAKDSAIQERALNGLVSLYLFSEGAGKVVYDRSGNEPPLDLELVSVSEIFTKDFLESSTRSLSLSDVVINVIIFVPFGFLYFAALAARRERELISVILTLALGSGFSVLMETAQHFSMTRCSTLSDVFCNSLGAGAGVLCCRLACGFASSRAVT
jgi:hypothetical protein